MRIQPVAVAYVLNPAAGQVDGGFVGKQSSEAVDLIPVAVPGPPICCLFGYDLFVMAHRNTLLKIDGLINLTLGIVLLIFPSGLVAFLGVPTSQNAFYPNILGGVLFGIALALFLESRSIDDHASGLGLLGAVAINLCGGLVLGAWLIFGNLELPLRGSIFLWSLVTVLVGISSIGLASKFSKPHT